MSSRRVAQLRISSIVPDTGSVCSSAGGGGGSSGYVVGGSSGMSRRGQSRFHVVGGSPRPHRPTPTRVLPFASIRLAHAASVQTTATEAHAASATARIAGGQKRCASVSPIAGAVW